MGKIAGVLQPFCPRGPKRGSDRCSWQFSKQTDPIVHIFFSGLTCAGCYHSISSAVVGPLGYRDIKLNACIGQCGRLRHHGEQSWEFWAPQMRYRTRIATMPPVVHCGMKVVAHRCRFCLSRNTQETCKGGLKRLKVGGTSCGHMF